MMNPNFMNTLAGIDRFIPSRSSIFTNPLLGGSDINSMQRALGSVGIPSTAQGLQGIMNRSDQFSQMPFGMGAQPQPQQDPMGEMMMMILMLQLLGGEEGGGLGSLFDGLLG